MFSIIIPTLNNLDYLKLCISSIKKNSSFDHEIILHINSPTDGTLEYAKENSIKYSHTTYNAGICEGVNRAAKLSKYDYIMYAHDDFYFCPEWDVIMVNELKLIKDKLFYLSGTMIHNGQIEFDCGDDLLNFDEKKLLTNHNKINYHDFQGSTWAPHLVHKELWNKVGGFSEEFFPGTGSDPDLNMKLWNEGVRIFKGLGKCKVYHFGSIVTRKYKNSSYKTESGSKGGKIFLLKWGITIKFFTKYYLNGCKSIQGKLICKKFENKLTEPPFTFDYFISLIGCKLNYFYLLIINFLKFKKN